jgi:hypothetical protein
MTRKTVLSITFLSITGVAVGWEIAAAIKPHDDLVPWTDLIADYVPPPVAWAAVALLVSWLPGHLVEAFAKRGKTMESVTIPATPEPDAAKEPLLSVGTITAFAAAALGVGAAFGLPLTDAQTGALLGLVPFAAALIVAIWGRKKVFSPATTRAMVVEAAASGQVKTEATVVPAESQGLSEPRNPGTGERLA